MSREHEQAVLDFLKLFHTRSLDLRRVRAALAPAARYQPIVPMAPPRLGADAICRELERQFAGYDQCDCQIVAIASSGDHVFTERVDVVRMFNGREPRVHVVAVFQLDEQSRIVSWREYWDALDVAHQIGVSPDELKRTMRAGSAAPA